MNKCAQLPENFVVIDLETTGFDPAKCGILEIGAADARGRKFYRRVALGRGREVQAGALACNGIDALDVGYGKSVESAMVDLFHWLGGGTMRWVVGGKNPQFDYGFLSANWPKGVVGVSIGEVLSRRCLDLHSLAYAYAFELGVDIAGADFSTDDIYEQFGLLPEPKPHNALRGVLHEMEGFRRLLLEANVTHEHVTLFNVHMENMDRAAVKMLDLHGAEAYGMEAKNVK